MQDNYDRFERYDNDMVARLSRRPVCSCCNEYIQSEYCYIIGDMVLCEECVSDCRRYTQDMEE